MLNHSSVTDKNEINLFWTSCFDLKTNHFNSFKKFTIA